MSQTAPLHSSPTETGTSPSLHGNTAIQALLDELGDAVVLTGEHLRGRQLADWSAASSHEPLALVLPRTPADVSAALRICHAHGQPIAIQGGLTGLAGGANAQAGEIALSLARLDRIEHLDPAGGTAIVQAGVTLQALQEAAAAHGLQFPLDLGARGSCQLGGNAATNAGGNRVLRFGMMRNLVLGLEAVLADGTVLTLLDRVIKNNAGYDLKQLFIGSEGTLGVITRLSLSLAPIAAWQGTALCAVRDFPSALALLRQAKAQLPGLTAFELMWQAFFEAAIAATRTPRPFADEHPLYVLIESSAASEAQGQAAFESMLERAMEEGIVDDAVIAQSQTQTLQLWGIRESVDELLAHHKPCAAFDVSAPIEHLDALVQELDAALRHAYPAQSHLFFGHLGDGNLHLISGPYAWPHDLEQAEQQVYACTGRFKGSISAEHGVGVVKRPFLHHSRGATEVAWMRQLKSLFDPRQILNRNRIFEAASPSQAAARASRNPP